MTAISSQQSSQEAQQRKQKLDELKQAATDWLSYNRKILKAQASFLKNIRDKRTDTQALNTAANNIRPYYLKALSDFLGS